MKDVLGFTKADVMEGPRAPPTARQFNRFCPLEKCQERCYWQPRKPMRISPIEWRQHQTCNMVRRSCKQTGAGISNHKSVRKVAASTGNTTRSSRINTAEYGFNSSLRGDFFRSRAVLATRTESVKVSSKSMLQSTALQASHGTQARRPTSRS
jgi:hypothetical protein